MSLKMTMTHSGIVIWQASVVPECVPEWWVSVVPSIEPFRPVRLKSWKVDERLFA
jgi:hypothetical protein